MDLEKHRNPAFSASEWRSNLSRDLAKMAVDTNRTNWSLSEQDLDELRQARAESLQLIDDHFSAMIELAATRRANLLADDGILYLSLGEDCLSRVVLAQWGLIPPAVFGTRSGPFDLAVHPPGAVAVLLEENFAPYFAPGQLRYDADIRITRHPLLGIVFNHESGTDFAADDFAKLRARYRDRVDHFEQAARTAPKTAFIIHLSPLQARHAPFLRRIHAALRTRRGALPFALIVVSSWDADAPIDTTGRERFADSLFFVDVRKPTPNYVWHAAQDGFVPSGQAFERSIVTGIKAAVAEAFGVTVPA